VAWQNLEIAFKTASAAAATVPAAPRSAPRPEAHAPALSGRRRALLGGGLAAGLACFGAPALARAVAPVQSTLTVVAYPLVDEILRAALPAWQAAHPGVRVQVVSRQYADHHTAMTTALSTATLLPDVMALEASYLGRFAPGLGLEDLRAEPYRAADERQHFVPYAFDQAVNQRGAIVALPTDIGPGTLLYRQDILARAGVDETALTTSWEGYVEAGRRIKARTGAYLIGSAQMLKDIVIRSGIGAGEGLYFDRDSRVLVTSPRFVRAFELARSVRRDKLDARTTTWTNDWAEGFKRGTVATELSGAWMVGQLANWVAPATRTLWRAAQLPEGTFVSYGGTFYAMPRRADPARKALAWDLIRFMTLRPETQAQAFRTQDAFPALLATHEDPFFDEPLPFLGGQPARRLWREAARRIQALEIHKQSNFADEVINTELDNVMDRAKPIPQALADAERLLVRRARR
jgi:multiple sugar transport system substrate-binding protein